MTAASRPGSPPSTSPIAAAISAVAPCLVAAVTRTFIAPSFPSAGAEQFPSGPVTALKREAPRPHHVAEIVAQQGDQQSEHRDAPVPEPPAEQHQAKVEGQGRQQIGGSALCYLASSQVARHR